MIYFHLIIMDLLNSINGVMVSVQIWKSAEKQYDWQPNNWTKLEGYLFVFTFDVNIFLVFGLALIRVLWLSMSALTVIRKLNLISTIAVGWAYSVGLWCCLYVHFMKLFSKKRQPFPDLFVEVFDLSQCVVILVTIGMSVYTQIRIRFHKSEINTSMYYSASRTSFVITLNLAVSYCYYLVLNVARIYFKVKSDRGADDYQRMCNSPQDWSWIDVFLCADMNLGVTFMCFNSLVNSIVLLNQVR